MESFCILAASHWACISVRLTFDTDRNVCSDYLTLALVYSRMVEMSHFTNDIGQCVDCAQEFPSLFISRFLCTLHIVARTDII